MAATFKQIARLSGLLAIALLLVATILVAGFLFFLLLGTFGSAASLLVLVMLVTTGIVSFRLVVAAGNL